MLKARLLGGFDLSVDGHALDADDFERPSGIRVLKLLLATPGHQVRREAAAELLWPEVEPDRSSANLRKAIHFARKALAAAGDDAILAVEGPLLGFRRDADLSVDVDDLLDAIDTVEHSRGRIASTEHTLERLRELERLGGADLLPDDPYEEWLVPIRERLRERALAALVRAATIARDTHEPQLAFTLISRALALEPADEAAHRIAIELHLDAGQIHAARRQLVACRRAVADTYGIEPDPALGRLINDAIAHRPLAAERQHSDGPLIGRRVELERAEEAFDAVASGRSAAVVIRGKAGIGKSRLLREVVRTAAAADWRIVETRGIEGQAHSAYGDLAPALANAFGADDMLRVGEPARSALQTAAPALGTPDIRLASESALETGLLNAIARLAERPVVYAVDDMQWLDPASLGLLRQALTDLVNLPVLFVFALRDDQDLLSIPVTQLLGAANARRATVIQLGSMGPREISVLLGREAGDHSVDERLSAEIADLSSGAPLFALEIFRSARDDGSIHLSDGSWRIQRGANLPASNVGVAKLVKHRVGQLDNEASRVLSLAAELGDEVSFDRLQAAEDGSDEVILDALEAGISAGLLVDIRGRYRFAHPLFRAALRENLRLRDRADLHHRVAIALAAGIDPLDAAAVDAAARTGIDIVAIASHASQAADLGRKHALMMAVSFGLAAGMREASLFDYETAVDRLRDAVRRWHSMPLESRTLVPVSAGQVALGRALMRCGQKKDARAAFASAIATASDDTELARAYSAASWLPYEHGHFDQAESLLSRGQDAVTEPFAAAILQSERAWVAFRTGRLGDAHSLLMLATEVLGVHGPSRQLMRALDRLGIVVMNVEGAERAVPILERALALAAEFADTGQRAATLCHLGEAFGVLRRFDAAVDHVEQALQLCALAGDLYTESVALWTLAEVEHARGCYDEAISLRRRELDVLSRLGGNAQHEAMAHAHLAFLLNAGGDRRGATAEAAVARQVARHAAEPGLAERIETAISSTEWPPRLARGNEAGTGELETHAHG